MTLFIGGTRSGKSLCAERYAAQFELPVLYLATAELDDEDMELTIRIMDHQIRRPLSWTTFEQPTNLVMALEHAPPGTVVLLDCFSRLVHNLLEAHRDDQAQASASLAEELDAILATTQARNLTLIIVTKELGMGLGTDTPEDRAYHDLLGLANQRISAVADEVYLVIAGLPIELKHLAPVWHRA
ncbi:bifunctional adenosylcobinamide kinase/adenosylcobinamide-phosphate guanylyltransferase [Candidatus Chloroploca sp. Khr17]|uniref:bifunctional adenosylcobinamide kinase/adenosylcobinamide-phosphate guanylyltransferase n=1 Tax=Candidatus Chloroploca sp. Khr17 TaxID=2496869 RepID=UPI001F0EBC55|nr:bifunctional adenosylcobinamide kinase/adenosylcobinamide-phosphate guanylyltransferase [Candidatus Chloroploca sp. Khr17]